jgi:hypothetical protein
MFPSPAGGRLIFDSAGFPLDVVPQAERRLIRFACGVALSLVLHGLLLWFAPIKPPVSNEAAAPLEVSLLPPQERTSAQVPVEPVPPPVTRQRPMMTAPRSNSENTVPLQPEPQPEARKEPVQQTPNDFASLLEARRAERLKAEAAIAAINAQFRSADREMSGDERAAAAAQRNLAALGSGAGGTGGVFSIVFKGHRYARYAFNGWQPNRSSNWKEVIEVDAGAQGDVDRAIVKSMIALIRKHYQGNFNWDSHRLGRVIVLSAKLEDNQGLEEFLMREFFGP